MLFIELKIGSKKDNEDTGQLSSKYTMARVQENLRTFCKLHLGSVEIQR